MLGDLLKKTTLATIYIWANDKNMLPQFMYNTVRGGNDDIFQQKERKKKLFPCAIEWLHLSHFSFSFCVYLEVNQSSKTKRTHAHNRYS